MARKYQRLATILENCTTQEKTKSRTFVKEFRNQTREKTSELRTFREEKEQELLVWISSSLVRIEEIAS
jgi:hypothetical protein